MTDILYIEKQVMNDPLTKRICARYPNATRISCQHYGEIFNRHAQNFRLQKQKPAIILARKQKKLIMPAPPAYGLDGDHHYYFSHMLNCVYDCRYCFLQGMYRSANYVLFTNYSDFKDAIINTLEKHPDQQCWFYSGYDCDSLAFDPVTGFVDEFIPFFRQHPQAHLELRSKSPYTRSLLKHQPLKNAVIAYSFTPEAISQALEHGVPALNSRLKAIKKLQQHGWKIGLRFDPLIYSENFRDQYRKLFQQLFRTINPDILHSVSLGSFRLPRQFFSIMTRLYPDDTFLAGPFTASKEKNNDMIGYQQQLESTMIKYCSTELQQYIPESIFFPCYEDRPASK